MLENKVILITGAAKGMGAAHSELCASYGATVIVSDLDESGTEVADTICKSGGKAVFHKLDVSKQESWKSLIDFIMSKFGRLDGLVNNAGIVVSKPLEVISESEFDKIFAINVKGVFLGCQLALPAFKAAGKASIVNISSTSGIVANLPGLSAYCATKGAVRLFTKALAVDFAQYNIRANSVHPGTIETPLVVDYLKDPAINELLSNAAILKRVGKPSEVSEAVAFLLSDKSSYMTGSEMIVDGGVTAV